MAGGGSGDATLMLAQQMATAGRPGTVTWLDRSAGARKVAGARVAARSLENVRFEEGSILGFGGLVMQHLAMRGLLDGGLKIRPMCLPDRFIDHEAPRKQYDEAGLNAPHIVATALAALGQASAVQPARA